MKQRTREDWRNAGVTVGEDVDPENIAGDAVIYPGSRIQGAECSIGSGCVIGAEAPATVANCQLGRNVHLKGGFFSGSTFLDGSSVGSGAHIRAGTILEEEAGGAHSVGLKQTIFLPFVTAGSLINFCDALMAGGTSRKNHSEIGSSYVHFNYTPHQDKATASLLGDVPNGVFLDNKPIFLGGQGGLLGPARIAYGTVVAAGGVCRRDIAEPGQLHIPAPLKEDTRPYETGVYGNIDRIIRNNLSYIGNIMALREWYRHVRCRFSRDGFDRAVLNGGLKNLDLVLAERINRMGDLCNKMAHSIQWLETNGGSSGFIEAQRRFMDAYPRMEPVLMNDPVQDRKAMDRFLGGLPESENYLETIRSLPSGIREAGCAWLQSIVDGIEQLWR